MRTLIKKYRCFGDNRGNNVDARVVSNGRVFVIFAFAVLYPQTCLVKRQYNHFENDFYVCCDYGSKIGCT